MIRSTNFLTASRTRASWTALVLGLGLCVLPGCQSQPEAPHYKWPGVRSGLGKINQRAEKIDTLFSQARVTVVPPAPPGKDADQVTFDAQMAAKRPDKFRLRASKFDRQLLDLVVRGNGLWLWTSDRIDQQRIDRWLDRAEPTSDSSKPKAPGLGNIASPWSAPILQPIPIHRLQIIENDAAEGRLVVRWPISAKLSGGANPPPRKSQNQRGEGGVTGERWSWIAVIDRPTLTVKEYRLLDAKRRVVQRIKLGQYRLIDNISWPTRVRGSGKVDVEIRFSDTRFNRDLPAAAFDPPPDARKLNP